MSIKGLKTNSKKQKKTFVIKKGSAQYKTAKEEFEQMIQHAPIGFYEIDFQNMCFLRVNEVMSTYTGYTQQELMSMNPMDLLTDASKQHFTERLQKLAQGEKVPPEVEYEVKTKQGDIIWTLIKVQLIKEKGKYTRALVIAHDVTDQKKLLTSLQESENKLQQAEQTARMGHVELDVKQNRIYWSKTMYDLLERDPKQGPPTYEEIMQFIHDEDAHKIQQLIKRAIKLSEPYAEDIKLILPSGKTMYCHVIGKPVKNNKDQVTKIIGTVQDITNRILAMQQTNFEKNKLDTILNSMDDGVYIVDDNGNIEFINHIIENEFGPIDGKKCFHYFHGRKTKCPWCKMDQVKQGKRVQWQWRSPWSHKWYDIVETPIENPNGTFSKLKLLRDITKQKVLNDTIKQNEEKYRFLYENRLGFNVIIDENNIVQEVNKTALDLLAYTKKEVIGTNIKQYIIPTQRKIITNLLKKIVKGEQIPNMDVHILDKNNQIHTIMFSAGHTIVGNTDDATSYLFTGIDITDRKKTEQQLEILFKNTPDIFSRFDLQHRYLYITPSIARITGVPSTQYIGKTNEELGRPPEVCNFWNQELDRVIKTGKIEQTEYIYPSPKGLRYFNLLLVPELNVQGDVTSVLSYARDVTPLREYEKKIENIAKFPMQNPHPVIRVSTDGTLLYQNPASKIVMNEWHISKNEKVPKKIHQKIQNAYKQNKNLDLEVTLSNKTYFCTITPIKDKEYVNLYFLDITVQKEIEKNLWESKEQYRLAQKASGIGSWDWDTETSKLSWSENIEPMFGLSPGTFSGRFEDFFDLIHPDDQEHVTQAINKCIRTGKEYHVEHRIISPDGKTYWMEELGNILHNNQGIPYRMLGTVKDITKEKHWDELQEQLKKDLKRERDLLQVVMENTDANLAYLDQNFNFVMVNSSYIKNCGFSQEQLVGKNHFDLFPDQENEAIFKKARDTGKQVEFKAKEFTIPGKTNPSYWNWSLTPIHDTIGNVQGLVLSLVDVTDIIQNEKRITELNKTLINKTNELKNANNELKSFTYSASHDLQAPLRSISGFSEILLEDYYKKLDNPAKDYLQRIINASNKMSRLITDLLKLSRISQAEMKKTKINLSKLAHQIITEFKEKEPHYKIKIDIEPNLIDQGDKNLLIIALNNLIGNAWKFSHNQYHPHISIGKTTKHGQIVYYIKDNGAGFDMNQSEKLFTPFQRLHNENEYPGTGIGLPLVARIIHRHNGRIWAESKEGHGATFYFTLK